MLAVVLFAVIVLTVVATTAIVMTVQRHRTRARFDGLVAQFERDLASPPWPPIPHEYSAEERIGRFRE
jgi:hypothetical protein